MKTYDDIRFNYHEYDDKKVYITIGLNIGVTTKLFKIDNSEVHVSNLAFANVYADYLKLLLDPLRVHVNVDRVVTTVSLESDQETWVRDMITFLNSIFIADIDQDVFEKAYQKALSDFEKAYKDGGFRALYKAYEYADTNKQYEMKTLLHDLQAMDAESFRMERDCLVVPDNACLFVDGNLSDVSDEERKKVEALLSGNIHTAVLDGMRNDPQLKQDAHLVEQSRQDVNLDILSLGFREEVSVLDKMIYLLMESGKIPGEYKIMHVDEFDSSLLVMSKELQKLKNYLKRPATEEQFLKTREGLLGKYHQWMEEYPVRFHILVTELELNGIAVTDFLNVLSMLTYNDYKDVAMKIRPVVSEAQIVMRRG